AQLELCQKKLDLLLTEQSRPLSQKTLRAFGVEQKEAALIEGGNFETLFRQLRQFLFAFVVDEEDVFQAFSRGNIVEDCDRWFAHSYWTVAFELFFSDALLNEMFTPAATQHAPAGSYPGYFRSRLEEALRKKDAEHNPFLQHIFLGQYLSPHLASSSEDSTSVLPSFLTSSNAPRPSHIELRLGLLQDVADLERYQVIALSNVMDWLDDDEKRRLLQTLARTCRPKTQLILRQLNNIQDLAPFMQDAFVLDEEQSAELTRLECSAFYERVQIWRRT
ncbi:MAG: DUF3419 family protein, partial [Deltaproteobacteria bacterium]|nr:DUF3419 family protein [Deltaproteobacteria bacterium]